MARTWNWGSPAERCPFRGRRGGVRGLSSLRLAARALFCTCGADCVCALAGAGLYRASAALYPRQGEPRPSPWTRAFVVDCRPPHPNRRSGSRGMVRGTTGFARPPARRCAVAAGGFVTVWSGERVAMAVQRVSVGYRKRPAGVPRGAWLFGGWPPFHRPVLAGGWTQEGHPKSSSPPWCAGSKGPRTRTLGRRGHGGRGWPPCIAGRTAKERRSQAAGQREEPPCNKNPREPSRPRRTHTRAPRLPLGPAPPRSGPTIPGGTRSCRCRCRGRRSRPRAGRSGPRRSP